MEKLLENMGFTRKEIETISPEIEKFISYEENLKSIRKDIRKIKVSLVLIVMISALALVS